MAADVSSLVRILGGGGFSDEQHRTVGNDSKNEKPTALITRDLLGGSSKCVVESQELDLDLQVPTGWEKRLDLEVRKIQLSVCFSGKYELIAVLDRLIGRRILACEIWKSL